MADAERVIRASEVGAFVYCARAWWLGSVEGRPSANAPLLRRGTQAHRWHGLKVAVIFMLIGVALLLAGLAAWLALTQG